MKEHAGPPLSGVAVELPPEQRQCGSCRFSVPVQDIMKIDCRWGPPTPALVSVPAKDAMGRPAAQIQQMITYPQLPRNFPACHRHEWKLTAAGNNGGRSDG
jgi:hypothetical protein